MPRGLEARRDPGEWPGAAHHIRHLGHTEVVEAVAVPRGHHDVDAHLGEPADRPKDERLRAEEDLRLVHAHPAAGPPAQAQPRHRETPSGPIPRSTAPARFTPAP